MQRFHVLALVMGVVSVGCEEATAPAGITGTYALARIGNEHPPIGQGPEGTAPFLLADTLRLEQPRSRDPLDRVLRWIRVWQDAGGHIERAATNHNYSLEDGLLSFDSCPREYFCAAAAKAGLVYAPLTFVSVGDSLFQVFRNQPPGKSAVYGRVRR
jgi:hypothetical protein